MKASGQSAAKGPKELRESWHNRTISEVVARLSFLADLVSIEVHKQSQKGADIEIKVNKTGHIINIEMQQDVSGSKWPKTVAGWAKRHDLLTFIVSTEPFVERLRSTK